MLYELHAQPLDGMKLHADNSHAEDEAVSAFHTLIPATHDTASYKGCSEVQIGVVLVCLIVWASISSCPYSGGFASINGQ